jgi:hypothetical protein
VLGTAAAKQWSKLGSHLKHLNLTFPSVSFHSGIRNDPAFFLGRDRAKRGADAVIGELLSVIGSGKSAAFAEATASQGKLRSAPRGGLGVNVERSHRSEIRHQSRKRHLRGYTGHVAVPNRSIFSPWQQLSLEPFRPTQRARLSSPPVTWPCADRRLSDGTKCKAVRDSKKTALRSLHHKRLMIRPSNQFSMARTHLS